jgi:hypothetical protein
VTEPDTTRREHEREPVADDVAQCVRAILSQAEELADSIRRDAEHRVEATLREVDREAERRLDQARRHADEMVAKQAARLSELSDEVSSRAQATLAKLDSADAAREQLDRLLRELGEVSERMAGAPPRPASGTPAAEPAAAQTREEPALATPFATEAPQPRRDEEGMERASWGRRFAPSDRLGAPTAWDRSPRPDAPARPVEAASDANGEVRPVVADPPRAVAGPEREAQVPREAAAPAGAGDAASESGAGDAAPSSPEAAPEGRPRDRELDSFDGARLVAFEMALAGSPRAEVAAHLQRTFQIDDPHRILNDAFTSAERRV